MIKYEFTAIIKKDLDKVVSTKTMFLSLLPVRVSKQETEIPLFPAFP